MIGIDFGIGALEAEFWRWIFVMTRIGAALLAAPLFGGAMIPPQVRVIATGALALFVCAWTQVAAPAQILSLPGLLALAGEALIGLALGFVLQMAFAAPVIGAEMIGAGMGMAIAASVDPVGGAHAPIFGQFFIVLLTVLFLGTGAHLDWISLVVESYRVFPPGSVWLTPARMQLIAGFGGEMILVGLAMALPVVLLLLVVQILTGVIGRSAPALNLYALALPAGVLAGLAAMIAAFSLVAERLTDLAHGALAQAAALIAN